MASAYSIKVRGVVQGVGFRPFVYRLAHANRLAGWVLNAEQGVEMHLEGSEDSLQNFIEELRTQRPRAASMVSLDVLPAKAAGFTEFTIRESHAEAHPTVRISPDLPVCDECLNELFDSGDPRYQYPYINCTNCGPALHRHSQFAVRPRRIPPWRRGCSMSCAPRNMRIQPTGVFTRSRLLAPNAGRIIIFAATMRLCAATMK